MRMFDSSLHWESKRGYGGTSGGCCIIFPFTILFRADSRVPERVGALVRKYFIRYLSTQIGLCRPRHITFIPPFVDQTRQTLSPLAVVRSITAPGNSRRFELLNRQKYVHFSDMADGGKPM